AAEGQAPVFSQFYAAPLQMNPALAGTTLAPRISVNYRNQWPSIERAYTTAAVSYEQFLPNLNSGIGIMLQSDNAGNGIYRTNSFLAAYSYQLAVRKDLFLKIGLEGTVNQATLDWDRLVFGDQIDPIDGFENLNMSDEQRPLNLNKSYFDLGAGFLLYSPTFYAGLSIRHLNNPDNTFLGVNPNIYNGLPTSITAHFGGQFAWKAGNKRRGTSFISPNILLISQGGSFGQLNAGAYLDFSSTIFGGAWYRYSWTNADAAIFLFGVQYEAFKIGYSYDFTVSRLSLAESGSGGAHEISVTLNFANTSAFKRQRRANRYNDCLQIFR
ncbi:MAG: PorP/SprF family type IX secretion system membrane protein, partial [Bacteroidota bacterium]